MVGAHETLRNMCERIIALNGYIGHVKLHPLKYITPECLKYETVGFYHGVNIITLPSDSAYYLT